MARLGFLALFCALALAGGAAPLRAQSDELGALERQINAAAARSDWTQAATLARKALAIEEATKGPDDAEVAGTLKLIASYLIELDRNEEAEGLLDRAIRIFEKTLGPEDPLSISTAASLARVKEDQGKFADAYRIYTLTLDDMQQRYGARHKLVAVATNNLAYNLARQGRYGEAQPLYDKALAIARETMDEEDADLALVENNVAANLTARGRYLQAEPLYESALKIRLALLGAQSPDVASSYNGLALNLSAQGRYEDAAPLLTRALAIREARSANDRRVATSVNNLAHNLNIRGRPLEAAPLYARARDIWQRIYGLDHPLTAIGISNVAVNLQAQQRYAEAQPLFERALVIRQKILPSNHPDVADSWFKMGRNFRLQGKLTEAETGYRAAIDIRRQALGPLHPSLALALADYAELALQQGAAKSGEALARAREAVAIARKRREQALTGEGAGDGGAEQQALIRAQGADAVRADPLAQTFGTLLRALWTQPQPSDAIRGEAYEAAQDLETSVAALTMAQTAARTAAGSGPLTQAVREQQDLSARAFELDRRLLAALSSGNGEEANRLRVQIATVADQLSKADAALRTRYPDYAELVQPRALSVAATRERLADNEGLLLIVPVANDIFAFGLSRDKIAWHRLAGGAAEAGRIVRNLRCQIDPGTCAGDISDAVLEAGSKPDSRFLDDGYAAFDRAASHKLYADIVAPVEGAFAGKARLFVTVTGTLSGLPLGVLVTEPPKPGEDSADPAVLAATPWLADRYAMISLPSVSVLRALKRLPPVAAGRVAFAGYGAPVLDGKTDPKAKGGRLFAAADSDGATLADPAVLRALAPLPGTAQELQAMATTLMAPGSAVVTGTAATEHAVRADTRLNTARIVAFATHGVLPQEVSGIEEPGLVFTPPAQASGDDDGLLAASEVAKLSLTADWVLLSACNTASSDGTPGADSLSSLARAFLYAGASALLASHWRVSDDATARLTVETLAARVNKGVSRAEALQQAMRAVRTGKRADGTDLPKWDDSWAHPSAWGAFAVISNSDD